MNGEIICQRTGTQLHDPDLCLVVQEHLGMSGEAWLALSEQARVNHQREFVESFVYDPGV